MFVEYRVRKIDRYIVTRFEGEKDNSGTVVGGTPRQIGNEFASEEVAYEVAYALARADHERLGYPLDDERIQYPRRLYEETGISLER